MSCNPKTCFDVRAHVIPKHLWVPKHFLGPQIMSCDPNTCWDHNTCLEIPRHVLGSEDMSCDHKECLWSQTCLMRQQHDLWLPNVSWEDWVSCCATLKRVARGAKPLEQAWSLGQVAKFPCSYNGLWKDALSKKKLLGLSLTKTDNDALMCFMTSVSRTQPQEAKHICLAAQPPSCQCPLWLHCPSTRCFRTQAQDSNATHS